MTTIHGGDCGTGCDECAILDCEPYAIDPLTGAVVEALAGAWHSHTGGGQRP